MRSLVDPGCLPKNGGLKNGKGEACRLDAVLGDLSFCLSIFV